MIIIIIIINVMIIVYHCINLVEKFCLTQLIVTDWKLFSFLKRDNIFRWTQELSLKNTN